MNFLVSVILENSPNLERTRLVANEFIKEGTLVWHNQTEYSLIGTQRLHRNEIYELDNVSQERFKKYCWQDDWDYWIGCVDSDPTKDLTNFIDHSCDPNCWFQGDHLIVARKNLVPGESITIDYATCDTEFVEFDSECLCGSANCRRTIKNDDYLLPSIRQMYKGHFRSFLEPSSV